MTAREPAIVLVHPQMGENIGAAARAMYNFGLADLRLVAPRDGWPNPAAVPMASGAGVVLDRARVYRSTAEAIADLRLVFATTARRRDMTTPAVTPRAAAAEMRAAVGLGQACGLLFGAEKSGLHNDDVALADKIVTIPANPAFTSLNIAQSVLLLSYEWFQAGESGALAPVPTPEAATKADLAALFEHLESELDAAGFLRPPEKRPSMVRNLRVMLQGANFSEQDVRTLRGVIKALVSRRPLNNN